MMYPSWPAALLALLVLSHLSVVLVTVYFHRAMAHGSVRLSPGTARVCRFLSWLVMAMNPREFAAVHRKHHAACDRQGDPHSPAVHGLATVVLGGVWLYRRAAADPDTIARYGQGLPHDPWERFYAAHQNLGVVLLAVLLTLFLGWHGLIVWAVLMAWIPFWAAGVINGLGHAWGYRNFPTDDRSTNLLPWGIWLCGEELHNNHHAAPVSPCFSMKRWEVDLGWWYIRALRAMGLATLRERAPLNIAALPAEHRSLSVVLRDRPQWLARFHRHLTSACLPDLRTAGFRRWSQLSASWDAVASGAARAGTRRRVWTAQRHPLLARLRRLETTLRALTSARVTPQAVLAWQLWLEEMTASGIRDLAAFVGEVSRLAAAPAVATAIA